MGGLGVKVQHFPLTLLVVLTTLTLPCERDFVPYYSVWTTYERVPCQNTKKRLDWTNLQVTTKLLKKWTSKRTHGVAYRGLCVSQRAPRSAVRYKACVLVNGGYFEHRMKC